MSPSGRESDSDGMYVSKRQSNIFFFLVNDVVWRWYPLESYLKKNCNIRMWIHVTTVFFTFSVSSYLDGVPVKISERYRPPRKVVLPVGFQHRLGVTLENALRDVSEVWNVNTKCITGNKIYFMHSIVCIYYYTVTVRM
jgi:hypothetical protein